MLRSAGLASLALVSLGLALFTACGDSGSGGAGGGTTSAGSMVIPGGFCEKPGSVQFTDAGKVTVPGGKGASKVAYLKLPTGFCAHWFGNVGNARQMRFAPGGELFVASPTTGTTGGGKDGDSAIIVLPDDDGDGLADSNITFQSGLPSTQGLLFIPGWFYYQDDTRIMRVPYAAGQRAPSGAPEQVADIQLYVSALHWPKTLDVADDGTIYVGNGGDQAELCDPSHPFHGGILKLDGSPGGAPVAKGLRNPIAVRCAPGHDQCFALELAKDYSASEGGREKLLPIRQGDDWGFPCCATKDLPYLDSPPGTDCSAVTPEDVGFLIGDTPFGLAFGPSTWPAAYDHHAFVVTHGAAGPWTGARMVSIEMDTATGLPIPGSNTMGKNTGSMKDFATGWDDGTQAHGRPSAVEFSADGRLFVSNDTNGDIFWIAPLGT
jgi:glucose/arabinose dehydrogenase